MALCARRHALNWNMCAFIGGRAATCGNGLPESVRQISGGLAAAAAAVGRFVVRNYRHGAGCRLTKHTHTRTQATVECEPCVFPAAAQKCAHALAQLFDANACACARAFVCVYARHRLCCAPASDFSSHNLLNDCIICNVVHYRCARPLGDDGNGVCKHARTHACTPACALASVSKSAL